MTSYWENLVHGPPEACQVLWPEVTFLGTDRTSTTWFPLLETALGQQKTAAQESRVLTCVASNTNGSRRPK